MQKKMIPEISQQELEKMIEEGRENRMLFLEERRKSCISRWYPIVEPLVATPRTTIIKTSIDLEELWDLKMPQGFVGFIDTLRQAISDFELPCFMRTGVYSGKHGWNKTCYVDSLAGLSNRVNRLVEDCGMYDLPTDVWAIREMLPTTPSFIAFSGRMPITKERRYFINDGKVVCHHPYWVKEAFVDQNPSILEWEEALEQLNYESDEEIQHLTEMSELVSRHIEGFWSVDWLESAGKWYLIDMGDGFNSYHYPECVDKLNYK